MTNLFHEIPYNPPPKDARQYADMALAHLRHFENLDPRLLAYLLAPSNVLALAGLRAMSPYNDALHPDINEEQFQQALAVRNFLWINENPSALKVPLESFALVNLDIADHLAETYPLKILQDIGPVFNHSEWGFLVWSAGLDFIFARLMEKKILPYEWIKEWWNPHNIRFGMLLGYPGPAISSFAWSELYETNKFGIEQIEISDGLFSSPSVGFNINKERGRSNEVTTTIKVWKETLALVYEIYAEERLMRDPIFAKIIEAKK